MTESDAGVTSVADVAAIADAATVDDLEDWGPVERPIEGESHTSGLVLHREPDGRFECGVWVCTPGRWECRVERGEFCQFLAGRATYVHDSGDVLEVEPGTAAYFPAGWTGECTVRETVRKTYVIE